ncbi:MAG: nitrite/sulfite reductase [Myxococcales bacterium]|nr:nitrite/sulfite reductase [Myxococcales bacterium]
MYQYDSHDQRIVDERARQFRGQVERRLEGSVLENEFKPLRLQNGLYMQLHAYMMRVAIPYGLLSSGQLRKLADIARRYDRGYGHFTTRQNLQYNWPALEDVPKILEELASVQMHAIQTSGNCIRNTTSDHFAGIAPDEVADPRPYAEIIRQWSTFHPEFAYLPRKFKIAVGGSEDDRAAVYFHDIGVFLVRSERGELGFRIVAGGGLGRTPLVAQVVRDFLPEPELLAYLESIMRVYNRFGRRDNKYKARIKILVEALGIEEFRRLVEEEWHKEREQGALLLPAEEVARVAACFEPPPYRQLPPAGAQLEAFRLDRDRGFGHWVKNNVHPHKRPGYAAVTIALKEKGTPPGDVSDYQMERVADLADEFSFGELRATHLQNLVLADVEVSRLRELYEKLSALGLDAANAGKVTDLIACPGLDFCNLANARSIPVALDIMERFEDLDYQSDLGELSIKISGCINACGHHHIGHLGVLGIDKQGVEHYQLMLGGSSGQGASPSLGKIIGPAFDRDAIVPAIETVLQTYLALRSSEDERFIDCYRRVSAQPFKEALYGTH